MNDVADALSRDDDITYDKLINIFRTFTPSQIPDHFEIAPLPNKIRSCLILLLQRLPAKEQLHEKYTRTKLEVGQDGPSTVENLVLLRTSSSDVFSRGQRIKIMGAFAMDVHKGDFSGPAYDTLAEGTVRGTISCVSQTFSKNNSPNPIRDNDGKLGRLLFRQYRSLKNINPNPEQ